MATRTFLSNVFRLAKERTTHRRIHSQAEKAARKFLLTAMDRVEPRRSRTNLVEAMVDFAMDPFRDNLKSGDLASGDKFKVGSWSPQEPLVQLMAVGSDLNHDIGEVLVMPFLEGKEISYHVLITKLCHSDCDVDIRPATIRDFRKQNQQADQDFEMLGGRDRYDSKLKADEAPEE